MSALDRSTQQTTDDQGTHGVRTLSVARGTVRLLFRLTAVIIALGGLTQGIEVLLSWLHRLTG
ncbi:MAG: hypothetical protein QOE58_923 [Actinomycetota bacterium]|nr:hypothetical protein [Actinomycetota bacterium]